MRRLWLLLGLACACDNWSGAAAGVDAGARYPAFEPPVPEELSRGGPVLATPRLAVVSFTDDTDTSGLEQYLRGLVASPWWDVLGEYGVGAATVDAVHVPSNAPTSIDDADIKTWLADRIASDPSFGSPDGTLYVLFYPAATTITILGH